jgi:hypothetical protein
LTKPLCPLRVACSLPVAMSHSMMPNTAEASVFYPGDMRLRPSTPDGFPSARPTSTSARPGPLPRPSMIPVTTTSPSTRSCRWSGPASMASWPATRQTGRLVYRDVEKKLRVIVHARWKGGALLVTERRTYR